METLNRKQETQTPVASSNFIKSMIKIANPEWTEEQIEAEAQRKALEISKSDDEGCEYCSS